MRIAYCTQTYPPMVSGAAIVAQGLAEGMATRWHAVLVLTASDQEQAYTLSRPNLTLQRFHSYTNSLRVGQRFTAWPHAKLLAALRNFKPDIIHTHDPFQLGWSALQYAHQTRTPILITIHQLPNYLLKYLPDHAALKASTEKLLWMYARALLSHFDGVLVPSETIASMIAARTNIKPHVAGFGIPGQLFNARRLTKEEDSIWRAKFGIASGVPVILHVGRLDRDKQVEVVIRAAALAMKNNQAELLIIGDGTEKNKLIALASELGFAARSHFPGFVRWEAGLANIYRMATLFVTASEIETQGLVLIEAVACGLPIVAFNATCIPEIVKEGVNGYLAAPGDLNGLASYIQKLIHDNEQARALGMAGHLIRRAFCLEPALSAHERIYFKTIARASPAGTSPARTWQGHATRYDASD